MDTRLSGLVIVISIMLYMLTGGCAVVIRNDCTRGRHCRHNHRQRSFVNNEKKKKMSREVKEYYVQVLLVYYMYLFMKKYYFFFFNSELRNFQY
jgi:hypothetical protein